MSEVEFKYPCGIEVVEEYSGFVGTIGSGVERINGCIQYHVTGKYDVKTQKIDSWLLDEVDLKPTGKKKKFKPQVHDFKYETGDKLKSRVNGFSGICIVRRIDKNGCEHYEIEGKIGKDGKHVKVDQFLQEVEKVDNGLNKKTEVKIEKEKVGCLPERVSYGRR